MSTDNSEHMRTIDRWLAGEVVNNTVGIKVVGGPFDGQTKIVLLGEDGRPPAVIRASDGPAGPSRHAYEAVRSTDVRAGWIYAYTGPEPATES
ncbi:hypothetical protein ACIHEI_27995 [Kitasatospora sp. NPDC051984]|uniref:hypothetical protein n=1 Tax=Kitasatospora sp. NPDC051984 TaxID=3364059 RepID=UPI0037C69FA2